MKKMLTAAIAVALFSFTACGKGTDNSKKCDPVVTKAPAAEITTLRAYITNAGITATEDARGFFYKIEKAGDAAAKPSSCTNVNVNYALKLTDGTAVESGDGIAFNLSQLIVGWQEGIPLIGAGGRIILYLPPSLAYGSQASGKIPANSNLIFTIDLNSIN